MKIINEICEYMKQTYSYKGVKILDYDKIAIVKRNLPFLFPYIQVALTMNAYKAFVTFSYGTVRYTAKFMLSGMNEHFDNDFDSHFIKALYNSVITIDSDTFSNSILRYTEYYILRNEKNCLYNSTYITRLNNIYSVNYNGFLYFLRQANEKGFIDCIFDVILKSENAELISAVIQFRNSINSDGADICL